MDQTVVPGRGWWETGREREREEGRRGVRGGKGRGGGGGAEEEDGIHVIIDNIYSRMQVYIIYDVIECSMFAMIVISSS